MTMLQTVVEHAYEIAIFVIFFGGWGAVMLIAKLHCMSDEERKRWGVGPKGQGRS